MPNIRPDAEGLAREAVAGAEESGDDLVRDHQHVVLREHRLDLLEIGLRRDDRTARTQHRLGDEGGHRLRTLGKDELLQLLCAPARERLLALARMGIAVVVVAAGMEDVRDRQIEALVHRGQAGERPRRHRDAVIAVLAGDDLLLFRLASHTSWRFRCRRAAACSEKPVGHYGAGSEQVAKMFRSSQVDEPEKAR